MSIATVIQTTKKSYEFWDRGTEGQCQAELVRFIRDMETTQTELTLAASVNPDTENVHLAVKIGEVYVPESFIRHSSSFVTDAADSIAATMASHQIQERDYWTIKVTYHSTQKFRLFTEAIKQALRFRGKYGIEHRPETRGRHTLAATMVPF